MNSKPKQIRSAVEGSLKRLGTDYIDLLYQHRVDPDVPMEDVAGVVKDLIQQGKVRFFGTVGSGREIHPPARMPCSPSRRYKANNRSGRASRRTKIIPTLEELGIGMVPFSRGGCSLCPPLDRGVQSSVLPLLRSESYDNARQGIVTVEVARVETTGCHFCQ